MIEVNKGAALQNHARYIEHKLRHIYNCDRFSLGGIINSDHIKRVGFVHSIAMVFASEYHEEARRKEIDDFLSDIIYYSGKSMSEIESESNGEVDRIMERFKSLRG